MAGITWIYLISMGVFIVLGVLVVGTLRRGRWGINLSPVHCPSCVTPVHAVGPTPASTPMTPTPTPGYPTPGY